MKNRLSALSNTGLFLALTVIVIAILFDLFSILKHFISLQKVNAYAIYQLDETWDDIETLQKNVKTTMFFSHSDFESIYDDILNKNFTSPYDMEDELRKLGFLQQYDYWSEDVISLKKKIANSKVDKIALLHEKRLFISYYEIMQHSLMRNGDGLKKFELAQTIVNDSTYFGTYAEDDQLIRYRLAMNGLKFDLRRDHTYQIPYKDYIHFELTSFRNRYTEIDSASVQYTIKKTGNYWSEVPHTAAAN